MVPCPLLIDTIIYEIVQIVLIIRRVTLWVAKQNTHATFNSEVWMFETRFFWIPLLHIPCQFDRRLSLTTIITFSGKIVSNFLAGFPCSYLILFYYVHFLLIWQKPSSKNSLIKAK